MKIDRIYVVCNRKDFYFTRICIASIRYWNHSIPVSLLKDISNGGFNTSALERTMNVSVFETKVNHTGYYTKLCPFMESDQNERILILDSDIIWMCDMINLLEPFDEDIIVDGYDPADLSGEMKRWYFKEPSFSKTFGHYRYPGFLFNVGQILCNTSVFTKAELACLLNWKEKPEPVKDVFFHEQGMLNYLLAEKIRKQQVSYRLLPFHRWGWNEDIRSITVSALTSKTPFPFLIHWYGNKNGLTGFLPGHNLLRFYESFYFSFLPAGKLRMAGERLRRTLLHVPSFFYESAKSVYRLFKKSKK
jgi:hypothetical protein